MQSRSPISLGFLCLLLFLTVAIASCVNSSFQAYELGDGRTLLVLKSVDDVFPVYAKTFKSQLDLALGKRDAVSRMTAGVQAATEVSEIYVKLDRLNAEVRNILVAAYSKYVTAVSAGQSAASIDEAGRGFDRALEQVAQLVAEVRSLNTRLDGVLSNTSGAEVSLALEASRALFQKWEGIKVVLQQD